MKKFSWSCITVGVLCLLTLNTSPAGASDLNFSISGKKVVTVGQDINLKITFNQKVNGECDIQEAAMPYGYLLDFQYGFTSRKNHFKLKNGVSNLKVATLRPGDTEIDVSCYHSVSEAFAGKNVYLILSPVGVHIRE
jgi:hypothetical protein